MRCIDRTRNPDSQRESGNFYGIEFSKKKKLQLIRVNGAAELNCTLARLLISTTKVLNNKIFAARFHPNQANYLYFSNRLA